jgi:hypothetical protein
MYSWHSGVSFKRKKPDAIKHRAFNLKTNPYTVIREEGLAMSIFYPGRVQSRDGAQGVLCLPYSRRISLIAISAVFECLNKNAYPGAPCLGCLNKHSCLTCLNTSC